MIEFQQVYKGFGNQVILADSSFRINPGDRVGIVGPNGTGKSTLFSLITGEQEPDKGDITIPKKRRLGLVRQQLHAEDQEHTLLDFTRAAIPELDTIHEKILKIEQQLTDPNLADKPRLLQQLGTLQQQYEHLGAYDLEARAEAALTGLGFKTESHRAPFNSFSGGWQMRAELARALIGKPDILLLDEPSNYLDVPAVEWLQRQLRSFEGTLLLISHDRYLLNSLTRSTLELAGGRTTLYAGPFDYYEREREQRILHAEAARKNQDKKREQLEQFVERFRAKNTKASQVQSRIKMLDKMEEIEVLSANTGMEHLRIPDPPRSGAELVRLEKVEHAYTAGQPILRNIDLSINKGDKTAVVGFNGTGKTTLLRILSGSLAPTGGQRRPGPHLVIGYQSQEYAETMPPEQSAFRIVKEANAGQSDQQVRTILGSFGFSGEAIDKPCRVLSGGEKIRLAFARIFAEPPNLLILDEPTTHLDIYGREALEEALTVYTGTVCLVSHDITFLRKVATSILTLPEGGGCEKFHGDYGYYLEKSAGRDREDKTPGAASDKAGRKEEKRARAQAVQERNRLKRKLEKTIRTAEASLEKLEQEQQVLLDRLAAGGGEDFSALNQRLYTMQQEMEQHTEAWETASIQLEELD